MSAAEIKSSCPRHGRSNQYDLVGLRCDCLSIVMEAFGGLKGGKWVRAGLNCVNDLNERILYADSAEVSNLIAEQVGDAVEARARVAIEEAVAAAYQLGLRGGVPRDRVRTCAKCREPFLLADHFDPADLTKPSECFTCYAEHSA